MKIRVIDIETTGIEPERDRVCEIGWTDVNLYDYMRTPVPTGPLSRFLDPGMTMPPEARAIHHISNEDVKGCDPWHLAGELLLDGLEADDLVAAHNAKFEQSFVLPEQRWICTLKCARHVWSNAPGYSNQALRYWLDLGLDERAMPPHRAGPDTWVTSHILVELLRHLSPAEMVDISGKPSLLRGNINFGKHRGARWEDVPRDYLSWIANKSELDEDTKFTARHYLKGGEGGRV